MQNNEQATPHIILRSDLNLEKWPLWQPSNSRSKKAGRTIQRNVEITRNGKIISETAKVTIGYVDPIGTLTTEDQKTFYGLILLWEARGRVPDLTYFSLRALARVLKKKWGTNVIESLERSLVRLRAVPLILQNAFYDVKSGETIESINPINILDDYKLIKRKEHGHVTKEAGYFKFDDVILADLLNKYTKPVLLDVISSFKNEMSQVLYSHLDLILAKNTFYERRTHELFEDELAIVGKRYHYVSQRLQLLNPAIKELEGIPITTGSIATIRAIKTKDGKDYKISVRKGKRKTTEAEGSRAGDEVPNAPVLNYNNAESAVALVQYFHQKFHQVENYRPPSKEIKQAAAALAKHGEKFGYYFVDFSYHEAAKTNYSVKVFGGILQYESQAQASYEKRRKQEEQEAARERLEQLEREYEAFMQHEVEAAKVAMPPEELATIEQQVQEQLQQEYDGIGFPIIKPVIDAKQASIILKQLDLPTFDDWQKNRVTLN